MLNKIDAQIALDRLWLEHFARAIYKEGLLNDSQYRELQNMIYRELAKRRARLIKKEQEKHNI